MDFVQCLQEFVNPTDNFDAANQHLLEMKQNDPHSFLMSLIEIIENVQNPSNFRLTALKAITMLGTHNQHLRFGRIQCDLEIVYQIFDFLFPFVQNDDPFGDAAYNVLHFFSKIIDSEKYYQEFLLPYVSSYDELDNPSEKYLKKLFTLCKTHLLYKEEGVQEDFVLLCNFFEQHFESFSEEQTKRKILKMIVLSIPVLTVDLIETNFDDFILSFYATYAPLFVDEFKDLQYSLLSPQYVEAKPSVIDLLIDVSSQSFDSFKLLVWHVLRQYATKEHCFFLVQRILENADVSKDEKFPISLYHMREIVKKAELEADFIQQIYTSFIEEDSTNGKYALSLIDEAILYDYLEKGDAMPENYQISLLDTFLFFLNDSNIRIKSHGFSLICSMIKRRIITEFDEYLQFAFDNLLSDEEITKIDCINIILSVCSVTEADTVIEIADNLFSGLQEHSEDEDPQYLKTILLSLSTITRFFSKEYAFQCLSSIWEIASSMFSESFDSPVLSDFVHLVGSLMENVSIEGNEMLQEIAEFSVNLIGAEEEDGYYLMNIVCKEFGEKSPEILQYCIEQVLERLSNATNEVTLNHLANICLTVVAFIDNPEALHHIAETCISYMTSIDLKSSSQVSLHKVLSLINTTNEECVKEFLQLAAVDFFKQFIYIESPSFQIIKYLISLFFVHVSTNQVPASDILYIILYHLLDFLSNEKEEETNKKEAVQLFLSALVPFFSEETSSKAQCKRNDYSNIIKYFDNEEQLQCFLHFVNIVDI